MVFKDCDKENCKLDSSTLFVNGNGELHQVIEVEGLSQLIQTLKKQNEILTNLYDLMRYRNY